MAWDAPSARLSLRKIAAVLPSPKRPTSANLFAVSATMSIRRCSFFCGSGMFTLFVTRYALPTRST